MSGDKNIYVVKGAEMVVDSRSLGWPCVITVALEDRGEADLEQGHGGVRLRQWCEWRMEKWF